MAGATRAKLLGAAALIISAGSAAHAQKQGQSGTSGQTPSQSAQPNGALTQTPSIDDRPAQGSAGAQEDATDIVVTGTRGALENAERTKRLSDVLVDGVSADDIGALPDTAISESLVRIPGITSNDRESGFEQVSVRGLGPDLTMVTYNGRTFPATSLVDRRTNLGDLPTEGIAAAIVQKTSDAATIQGGLAGTIGLQSIKPLDTKRRGLTLVARGIYDNIAKDTAGAYGSHPYGFRGEASYVRRFSNNFGVALTYSHLQQFNISPSAQFAAPATGAGNRADLDRNGVPDRWAGTAGVRVGARNQKRDAVIGTVQWDPSDSLRLTVDGLYIRDGGDSIIQQFFAAGLAGGTTPAANLPTPTSYTIDNDVVTQFDGLAALYRENLTNNTLKQIQQQYGFNAAFDNGGPIKAVLDVSWARASQTGFNRQIVTENDATTAQAQSQRINVGFDYRDRDNVTLNFLPLVADDYALSQILLTQVDGRDTVKAARLDLDAPLDTNIFRDLAFGLRFQERTKFNSPDATQYSWANLLQRPDLDTTFLEVATNPFQGASKILGGPSAAGFPLFNFDKVIALRDNAGVVVSDQSINDIAARSNIVETSYALWLQGNINAGPVTGNIGVRYILTDVLVEGYVGTTEANKVLQRGGGSYNGLLPALNLKYAITPTLAARFAYYKTVSPPAFGQQRLGFALDLSTLNSNSNPVINQGNPDLKPFTANNFDASLEWYPDRATSLAIQSFSKYVKNFVVSQSTPTSLTLPNGTVIPATLITSINDPSTQRFWGIEIILRRDFDFLPGLLSNLGLRVDFERNWTSANTNTVTGVGNVETNVFPNSFTQGLANAQLYYSTESVDVRLAYRHYSHYLRQADNSYQIRPSGTLDLSGSVEVLKGIRLTGIIQNLTNAATYQYFPDPRYPDSQTGLRNTIKDGRVITAGIRANF